MLITNKTKLLVISPHPGDEALGCGGLIGKCKKENAKVLIIYMCIGKNRSFKNDKPTNNKRLKEISAVEQYSKVKTKIIYIGDKFTRLDTVPQKDLIERIEGIIQSFRPTIITIPSSSSYNQDHRAVFNACISSLRPAPKNIRYFTPHVFEYFEPCLWSSRELKSPNAYLDLGETFRNGNLLDFKINVFKCHKTQVRKDPSPGSSANIKRLAHIYGKEVGISMAEPYHILRTEIC